MAVTPPGTPSIEWAAQCTVAHRRLRHDERMKRAWVEFWPHPSAGHGFHVSTTEGRRPIPPDEWVPPIRPVPGKGYPRIFVEFDGEELWFISTQEILHTADVLATSLVDPVTSQERWYRDFPSKLKSSHRRPRVAAFLRQVAGAYDAALPELVATPTPASTGDQARAGGVEWPGGIIATVPLRL
jgi:hypothetical protein